ncbi:MAG: hypothetical protein ACI8RA_002788 [Chlamydiales bacterium]|jgi:hypothetical protein
MNAKVIFLLNVSHCVVELENLQYWRESAPPFLEAIVMKGDGILFQEI